MTTYVTTSALQLITFVAFIIQNAQSTGWNYDNYSPHGPSNWKRTYPLCGGRRQSPINIRTDKVQPLDGATDLVFQRYDTLPAATFAMHNNGHSVQINLPAGSKPTMSRGGLDGTYVLAQFHFHWGQTPSKGSEHLINGRAYPLEIHLVHYKDEFDGVTDAAASKRHDALAVLGVFVNETRGQNEMATQLGRLAKAVSKVSHYGSETKMAAFPLDQLMPIDCKSNFYRYQGGLTTPGCNEVVIWTICDQPLFIPGDQLKIFRSSIHDAEGKLLTHNYRPVQDINGRTVYRYEN